jgi:hypothetical protein
VQRAELLAPRVCSLAVQLKFAKVRGNVHKKRDAVAANIEHFCAYRVLCVVHWSVAVLSCVGFCLGDSLSRSAPADLSVADSVSACCFAGLKAFARHPVLGDIVG